ncbi:hypothetical protein Poly24_05140 [Rosistilla carotiformis]|uniref:Uncharacterized protein n=1 Tax=Rosistilla carotiformis TaxID=2528017 RepID=A0A518JMN6_9BACT|nr:hypothetical protein [Rosistilla carotiformis]QDV66826.1 hypothetical protein Poly24_05140 [Rosistilla carotiformis]
MLNSLGKTALVSSTIAPVLGAFAVSAWSNDQLEAMCWYGGLGLVLTAIAGGILWECRHRVEVETLRVKKVKAADKESLAFLVVYLLPLLAKDSSRFNGDLWTAVYVFLVIGVVVAHGNLVTFNPVFVLFQLHFYEVETESGLVATVVSRRILMKQKDEYKVQMIFPFFYFEDKTCWIFMPSLGREP